MEYKLRINKDKVFDEVSKSSGNAGAKAGDAAYDRVAIVDADKEMLDRFWTESKWQATFVLGKMLVSETESDGVWQVTLNLPQSFKASLMDSIGSCLFSFIVTSILAKWYAIANKEDASSCAASASAYLDSVRQALYVRVRPSRPQHD